MFWLMQKNKFEMGITGIKALYTAKTVHRKNYTVRRRFSAIGRLCLLQSHDTAISLANFILKH